MVYYRAGGRSVNLISLVVSIHGRPQASIAAVFGKLPAIFSIFIGFLNWFFQSILSLILCLVNEIPLNCLWTCSAIFFIIIQNLGLCILQVRPSGH